MKKITCHIRKFVETENLQQRNGRGALTLVPCNDVLRETFATKKMKQESRLEKSQISFNASTAFKCPIPLNNCSSRQTKRNTRDQVDPSLNPHFYQIQHF